MKELLEEYFQLEQQEKDIKARKLEIQCAVYEADQAKYDEKDEGTVTVDRDGYRIKVVKGETISVDQELAEVIGIGFKKKYDLDKKAYKNLSVEDRKRVDECLTTKPKKPSFKFERMED